MTSAEVVIESIAAGGDGVARFGGVVVFVPRSAPGDRALVALDSRKRFARGAVVELIEASPERVEPACDHYVKDRCGGCQIQHLRYDAQLTAKSGIIRDTLGRIGKRVVSNLAVEPSARQWRYRTKLTLAMKRPRGGDWIIGLHPYDNPGRVFQLVDCPITDERVVEIWTQAMAARAQFPRADELRASVRLAGDGAVLVMEGGRTWPARMAFFDAVPRISSLWWKPEHGRRSLVAERPESPEAGASFAQVNTDVGARLHAYVLDRARSHEPSSVIDAYAGSGATAVPLANDGRTVVAIESDRDAAAACAARLPAGSRAVTARVEDVIEGALPSDLVLINPPRTGVHEHVSAALQSVARAPRAVIYVSCDPATLARDLSRMSRYRIASIRAFDMFPQTAHVETVCELVPEAA